MWDDIIIANLSWKWVCIFAIGAATLDSLLWLIRHHSWSLFGILFVHDKKTKPAEKHSKV